MKEIFRTPANKLELRFGSKISNGKRIIIVTASKIIIDFFGQIVKFSIQNDSNTSFKEDGMG